MVSRKTRLNKLRSLTTTKDAKWDSNWSQNELIYVIELWIDFKLMRIDLKLMRIDLKLMQIDMNWFEIEYAMNTQWLHNDYVMITQWLCNDYAMIFKKVWNLKNEVIPMTTKLIAFVVKNSQQKIINVK